MTAIAAVCENGGIGREGALLFHIREDLRRFRQLTLGKTVVMGRRTLESLPGGRGLPDRRNLVLTRDTDFTAPGAEVIHDLAEVPEDAFRQRAGISRSIPKASSFRNPVPGLRENPWLPARFGDGKA